MPGTREEIMVALETLLGAAYSFGKVTRRLASPETMGTPGSPGLALIKLGARYEGDSPSLRKRFLYVGVAVYCDAGTDVNTIPDSLMNPIEDAIDVALAPDYGYSGSGLCTLGGLVEYAIADGEVRYLMGDKSGKAAVIIPITICMP